MSKSNIEKLLEESLDIAEELLIDRLDVEEVFDKYGIVLNTKEIRNLHDYLHSAVREAIIAWGRGRG